MKCRPSRRARRHPAKGPAQWTIEGKPEALKIKAGEVEATANATKGRFTSLLSAWVQKSAAVLGAEASR